MPLARRAARPAPVASLDGDAGDLHPWRPADGAWNRVAASHLARRAALGSEPAVITRLLEFGPAAGARWLLRDEPDPEELRLVDEVSQRVGSLESVQAAWVYRLLRGPRPAREKLVLFWHDHFATANRKVDRPRLMQRQIRLFQARGAGPFAALLDGVARDPALLIWLDGNQNRRGQPNENFARELLELFALGLGHYTERDIQEAARAFTGWQVQRDEFRFHEFSHDAGEKEFLGRRGKLGGEEILAHTVAQPACARFVAGKLFRHYVHPTPSAQLEDALGALYRECDLDTGEFLVRLWSARVFWRPTVRRQLVAGPVDYAIGALRTLGARASTDAIRRALTRMGQELLQPPSVAGWEGGQRWLSPGCLVARYRFAAAFAGAGEPLVEADWKALEAEGPQAVVGRFFPEGLPTGVEEDLAGASGAELRMRIAGCLQLPECQYL